MAGLMSRILKIILLLSVYACGQEGGVYTVDNYQGGLNVATDGRNLRPDESLVMTNLTLDSVNCMVPRQGFSYLDSAAINTNQEIDAIYIYEPYIGTKRMIIATNGNIYITPTISDPGDVDWDTLRMGFTGDSLIVTNASGTVYEIGDLDWWYSKMGLNDTIDISGVQYKISTNNLADSIGTIIPNYAASTDTIASYTVYRKTSGTISLVQEGDKLYICASNQFPLVYNDTGYVYIALIDSGLVTDTTQLTGSFKYNYGRAHIDFNQNTVMADSGVDWGKTNVDVGYYFTYITYVTNPKAVRSRGRTKKIEWTSDITGWRDTTAGNNHILELGNTYPHGEPSAYWNDYEIFTSLTNCVFDSGWGIEDTNKNWMDDVYGKSYLQTFFAIDGEEGYSQTTNPDPSAIRAISCNEENTFAVVWSDTMSYDIGDHYYVFTRIPRILNNIDTVSKEFPKLAQIFFYSNQLFGHGYDRWGLNFINSGNNNRIWYSDFAQSRDLSVLHRYIRYNYNFDVDVTEDISVMFDLRNGAYIGTDKAIWRFGGTPELFYVNSDMFLTKIVSNMGIPDLDNWAKATEEYGYFTNRFGIYRFDGIRPEKVSWRVDPIIQANYASRIVMAYQDYRLYVSFPDSNFTLVYDERFDAFYKLDFGMTCAYAPPDTNIIYFGHSEFKGRVYYYPNGLFQDFVAIDDTNDIAITYESGWQSHGGYWKLKTITDIYFPINNSNSVTAKLYTDFSATACDTTLCDSTGWFVYRKQFDNDCVGEYFKVAFSGTVDALAIFGGYRIESREALPWRK